MTGILMTNITQGGRDKAGIVLGIVKLKI